MVRHRSLTCCLLFSLFAIPTVAHANGRPPSTSTINFQRGDDSKIIVGLTFGAVVSNDSGATWNWTCEQAIGYGGNYDPDYVNTATGIFATTFDGLKANRDSCTYQRSALTVTDGPCIDNSDPDTELNNCASPGFVCAPDGICEKLKFVSSVTVGPDGAIHAASADLMDGRIYKSTDNGLTFPVSAMPGQLQDWWQSLEVAPSNANVIYLSGYRLAGQQKTFLLFRSGDGGVTYNPLPVTDFAMMSSSNLEISGISSTNPDLLFARVVLADNMISDAVYRSTNGGQNWTKVLEKPESLSVLVRANGDLIASTKSMGSFRSIDNGDNWTDLVGAPHINCLAENAAGEVWACTQNYGGATLPSDGYGVMKTGDLVSWTGVLRYQDIAAPIPCAAGSIQTQTCDLQLWCGFCAQIGCNANRDCSTSDAALDGAGAQPSKGGGCCEAGDGAAVNALLGAVLLVLVFGRKRRRATTLAAGIIAVGVWSSTPASANGRAPATNGAFFHPTDTTSIYIRTTFGLLVSHDDGCSFRWVCEQNVGYGGMFDPKYKVASDGTLFATTFTGLRVSRDGGCSFTTATSELPVGNPNRIADTWIDALDIGPTGEVWVATADSGKPNDIYRSTDNGVTFTSRGMQSPTIWWKSLRVAPSDAQRVYVSGYEIAGNGGTPTAHLLVTTNGGADWTPSPLTDVQLNSTPVVNVVAVDPTNPAILYVVSLGSNAAGKGDRLYRSPDGGTTFVEVLPTTTTIRDVVIVDANTVLVANGAEGTFESVDGGLTFALLPGAPQLECLGQRSDGTLVGCGANWDPDFKAVARTTDLSSWQKAFRFVELAGPLECPAGTQGRDVCDQELWTFMKEQFGATGPTDPACSVAPPPADGPIEPEKSGCCDASSTPPASLVLLAGLTLLVLGRRRGAL